MTNSTDYHLGELEIIRSAGDPRRNLPRDVKPGSRVLDVGCGIGQSLIASEFLSCASRTGVDIDVSAITKGKEMFPELDLRACAAEQLPFQDNSFDLCFSRVAIPYTDVHAALAEMVRVTVSGGRLWLSLHSWQLEVQEILAAFRAAKLRRLVDRVYVAANSLFLGATGRCFARPWSGQFESFQFGWPTSLMLQKLGCLQVAVSKSTFFVVEARKA